MLGSLSVPGVLLVWLIVGQGPIYIALSVGVGEGCLDIFFSRLSFLSTFSLSGGGLIQTEILSQMAVKYNQSTNQPSDRDFHIDILFVFRAKSRLMLDKYCVKIPQKLL